MTWGLCAILDDGVSLVEQCKTLGGERGLIQQVYERCFYTVARLSRVLAQLHDEGYPLDPEAVAALSPYRTGYLDRFGHYPLDVTQVPEPLEYDLPLFSEVTQ